MASGESNEFFAPAIEQCVISHKECTCLLGNKHCKGRFEITFGSGSNDVNLESEALGRSIHISRGRLSRGVVGVTNSATTMDEAINSYSKLSLFGQREALITVTAVVLPPGRLKLATRPSSTGSPAVAKTTGIAEIAAFTSRMRTSRPPANITKLDGQPDRPPSLGADQIALSPAVFDRDVLTLDEACFLQALAERRHQLGSRRRATFR